MRVAFVVCLVAGCGVKSNEPFLVDIADCALVNNFKVDNAPTAWNDCRVYWSGSSTDILTVELTTPGTTGSFVAPAPSWIRASVQVPAGDLNAMLHSIAHPPRSLPSTVATDQLALDLFVSGCGNIGGNALMVDTMADVGDRSASFSLSVDGTCSEQTFSHAYTGGFIVSAAAKAGAMTTADPATPVTTP
jgi:hypothetical protein